MPISDDQKFVINDLIERFNRNSNGGGKPIGEYKLQEAEEQLEILKSLNAEINQLINSGTPTSKPYFNHIRRYTSGGTSKGKRFGGAKLLNITRLSNAINSINLGLFNNRVIETQGNRDRDVKRTVSSALDTVFANVETKIVS